MNPAGLRLDRLAPVHDLSDFASGNLKLDSWLVRHAPVAQQMDSARTFLLMLEKNVVGYFALTMGSVRRVEPPTKLVRGLPSYPVGMVLLARLAVERGSHRRGFGALLLAEALRKAVVAGEAAAARLVVVDAIDGRAADFYARYGFVAAPEHPLRLYRQMKDIRQSLAATESP
ncbi:MAG: GNAT family N-acetyltransferase [Acidimicrobiales bacterium]